MIVHTYIHTYIPTYIPTYIYRESHILKRTVYLAIIHKWPNKKVIATVTALFSLASHWGHVSAFEFTVYTLKWSGKNLYNWASNEFLITLIVYGSKWKWSSQSGCTNVQLFQFYVLLRLLLAEVTVRTRNYRTLTATHCPTLLCAFNTLKYVSN
jgi:hypothetical protein